MLGQQLRNTFDSSIVHSYYWGIVGAYIAVNALFGLVYSLSPERVSFLFPAINAIVPSFPIIMEPVEWLVKHGNPERAELIVHIYGFGWLSFLFLLPAFLLVAIHANQIFHQRNREAFERVAQRGGKILSKGILFSGCVMLLCVWMFLHYAYDGNVKFSRPCRLASNCIHIRDLDFIKVVFHNAFSLMLALYIFNALATVYWLGQHRGRKKLRGIG
jgi:hypothetical protein